jgi:acetylornithine deacetylase/succinyl-diaminopimelate desuccinylase-like protein
MSVDWHALADRVVRAACDLQQIPAPTFSEDQRAAWVCERFQAAGLDRVVRDPAGNVAGRLPGGADARPLIMSAHMDTVFPLNFPLRLERAGDRLNGPGIGDNAIGLGALVCLPEILKAAGQSLAGDLWLVATTGEEGMGDLRGIRAVADRFGAQAIGYISIEGMGLGCILHRGLGVERYRVSVSTRGGHSWVDYGAPSAVHELAGLAARLAGLRLARKPRTTFNIGVIQGGTSVNSIAPNAWMDLDLRSETAAGLAELSRQLQRGVEGSRRKDVSIEMERIGRRPAAEISKEHDLVRLAARALSELGIMPSYDIASTEANEPLSRGYPALTLGVTTGDRAHSADEYVDISPVYKGLRQLVFVAANAWV